MNLMKRNNENGLSRKNNYDWFGDDLLDAFWGDHLFPSVRGMMKSHNSLFPAMNVIENDKNYTVEIAVPGANKHDFTINLDENNVLEVAFNTQSSNESEQQVNEGNEPVRYLCREFSQQSFVKRIALPDEVQRDDIAASFENGVLKVEIPKMLPETKQIESKNIAIK